MPEVRMLVGPPYSGKSTYAENFKDYVVVSLDAIRGELGDASDQSRNAEVVAIARGRVFEALRQGKDIIYDATNLKRKYRVSLINAVRDFYPTARFIAVVFPPIDNQELMRRMHNRKRYVPKVIIDHMVASYTKPSLDEGFNDIIYL